METKVKLNNKVLLQDKTYIVLEAGPTHEGIEQRRHVLKAKNAGGCNETG